MLRHSEGAKFFQFWRRRQLLVEDFVSGLVLRGGSEGLSWQWPTLSSRTGPVTTGTLCGSSRQSRLAGSMMSGTPHRWVRGEGLGIPSLLHGCHTRRRQRRHVQGPRCSTSWPVRIKSTVMSVLGWFAGDSAPRAVFLALSSGPWFAASWPVWTRGTVCRCLCGLLVNLHLTLCFFLSSGPRCAVRVGVRIRLHGQGLCLSSWFWCSCSLPCAFVCGYGLWARIALVSPWSCAQRHCAGCFADTDHGQGLRLPLRGPGAQRHCARRVADTAYGQGLLLPLRGPGAQRHCACCFADTAYGQGLRLPLRGPGAQRHCARWYADTAFGQGLRLSLRGPGAHVFSAGHHRRPGLLHEAWCSVGPCAQAQGHWLTPPSGRGRGSGVAGSLTPR